MNANAEKMYRDPETGDVAPYASWRYWSDDFGYCNRAADGELVEVVTDGDGHWAVAGTHAGAEAEFMRAWNDEGPTQTERLANLLNSGFSNSDDSE
jgi:hypothetical protein